MRAITILLFFLLLTSSIALALDKIYLVKLNYNEGKFMLIDIGVIDGFYRGKEFRGDLEYNIKVISHKDLILWENRLDIGNIIYFSPPLAEDYKPLLRGPIILKDVNITEALPYFNDAKYIKVYYKDSEVFSIDVTKYSNYCGNNICNTGEYSSNCPKDCVKEEVKERAVKKSFIWVIGLVFVLIFILYIIYKRNKQNVL